MNNYTLDNIQLLLFDQQVNIRRVIKYALAEIGFRTMHESGSLEEMQTLLRTLRPDVVILDVDADLEEACAIIENIRHQRLGPDPFMVLIGTTWHPNRDTVSRVMNSGVDDIAMKPISVEVLSQRVDNLIHHRKRFISTSRYIGPDRRDGARANSEQEPDLIAVPNNLRYKAIGDVGAAVNQAAILETMEAMVLQRIQYLTLEVANLSTTLKHRADLGEDMAQYGDKMGSLRELIVQVTDYISERRLHGVAKIAESMKNVMAVLDRTKRPTQRQFEILRLHSLAVNAVLMERDGAAEVVTMALEKVATMVENEDTEDRHGTASR